MQFAAHQRHQLARDWQAEAGTAEAAHGIGAGLHEILENAAEFVLAHADTGIAQFEGDLPGIVLGATDHDRHAAGFGELDRIAGKIEQHLAQSQFVAAHDRRTLARDMAGDLDSLGMGAGRKKLGDALDQCGKVERLFFEIHAPRFDLRRIEDFIDDRQ